jgi:hypothetical protein
MSEGGDLKQIVHLIYCFISLGHLSCSLGLGVKLSMPKGKQGSACVVVNAQGKARGHVLVSGEFPREHKSACAW